MSMAVSARPRATNRIRRIIATVIAAIAACVLVGCGAVIDTTLTIKKDGSGTREITATLAADDVEEYVDGGPDAIVGVIEKNLPDGMKFAGVSEGEEGASVFTFRIPFDSSSDYQEKIIGVLGAGGVVDQEASSSIVIADSVFRNGVSVEENFTSEQLLAWLTEALIDGGTIPADQRSNVSEIGTTAVKVGGTAFDTRAQIDYSDVDDFGVRAMTVTTSGVAGDAFTRTIEYDLAREAYAHDSDGYDEFFASVTPENGELTEPSDTETVWTVTLTDASADEIVAFTNTALDSENTDFAVTHEPDSSAPGTIATRVVDVVDCSAVCAEDVTAGSQIATPQGWESSGASSNGEDGDAVIWSVPDSSEPVTFRHRVPFTSVAVDASVVPDGSSTVAINLAMRTSDVEAVGGGIEEMLQPTSTYGTLTVDEGDETTTYRVELTGDGPADLATAVGEYLPGSGVMAYETDSGLFSNAYAVDYAVELPSEWTRGGITDGITYTLTTPGHNISDSTVPSGSQVDGDTVTYSAADVENAVTMSVVASGINMVAIGVTIAIVVLVGAAIAVTLILVLRRKKSATAPQA